MADKLKIEFPAQGWEQFLTARTEMLHAFDKAREKSRAHKVKAYHGKVAEAEVRKWLSNFLPRRYGVTPGYIVSPGLKSNQTTPHFDVIIYDQLESPVLWVDDSPDVSPQGSSLAIPAEYVRCVLEVKANLSSVTSGEAIQHLRDLVPLMGGPDKAGEKYKLYLPPTFCCGVVFFDLTQKHQFSKAALSKLIAGIELRGFFGGIVLRGEGHQKGVTAKLSLLDSKTPFESSIGKNKRSLLEVTMPGVTKSVKIAGGPHLGVMLMWTESNFSQFGFDVLAMMQGTHKVGFLSSFLCMGTSELEQTQT
jgi:hypothetical protein